MDIRKCASDKYIKPRTKFRRKSRVYELAILGDEIGAFNPRTGESLWLISCGRADSVSDRYHMRRLQDQVQLSDASIRHTDNKTRSSIDTKPGLTQVKQGRGQSVVSAICTVLGD